VRIVVPWLTELVRAPGTAEEIANAISLRGFEVATVENGPLPVIDFEITANRPDCLSHVGMAREASAIWGVPAMLPNMPPPPPEEADPPLEVRIDAPDLCPRYCAQVFEVRIGPSPAWLCDRLIAAGVRPISNIVDVTNYVMLEIGQPMHAFDLERLAGRALVIRRARTGERLRTLDSVDRELDPEMLVIADAEHASAVGGVMGGGHSEISANTRFIALESAYFLPASIRRTSKRLALKTEASIRFERGGDVHAAAAGIARAAALFHELGAGKLVGRQIDLYPNPRPVVQVRLRASRIERLLGRSVPDADVDRILTALWFEVAKDSTATETSWKVTVPTFRVDVTREADLIEEVGRHYGFDRLPATFPALTAPQAAPPANLARDRLVRHVLTVAGFSEAATFAFIEREASAPFCAPGVEATPIANPLSEKFAVLRPSLLPGLVDSSAHNRRRERRDIQLFETGSRFTSAGEGRSAAFVWAGAAEGPHWSAPTRGVDFFDVKGVVEQICRAFAVAPTFSPASIGFLAPGRTADVRARRNGQETRVNSEQRTANSESDILIGIVGQINPAVAAARGFPPSEELYAAELDLEALAAVSSTDDRSIEPLPRYPSIVRDISMLVEETLPAATVRGTIRSAAPSTLVSIVEFDRYQGKGVSEGRVSLSIRLTFRAPDRTLTDQEAQDATERIVDALRIAHGAQQR
jgi:phenylalanyl-tRNA synthetase beta chain